MSELYENAVCLAPMVRSNTLPLRLVSLRYGADLVYGEEVVDKSIISTARVQNELLDSVDFVSPKGGVVVFRTCSEEKSKVVFQIGTADPILALKAAEQVALDVASVDINMGCPKHFSTQGGMGAALLRSPEVACDIIKTLRRNLSIPVSCKMRILHDAQATIDIAKSFEQAGAVAIGLHGRQVHERPSDSAHWDAFAPVVSSLSIPVLVNGDIFVREDIDKVRAMSGAKSFLIARGALSNASIFRKAGMLPYNDVVAEYLKAAAETDNLYHNTKYNLARMIPTKCTPETGSSATVADLHAVDDDRKMFALWDLQSFYDQTQERFRAKARELGLPVSGLDASFDPSSTPRKYDEAFVASQQFYCSTCHVQLQSDEEVGLHTKGKKHKKKLRDAASFAAAVVGLSKGQKSSNMSELYENAVCLAPMVRSGTLPLRLLSLRYGADLVYGEEIVDKRIIATNRVHNALLDATDYVSKNGNSVVFRTCSEEKSKVVFQIGTADPILALKAAEQVALDVASVDINMGCPKHFSTQGGMGAALLRSPEVACDIIKTLRRNLNIPVSCKIRILENPQATIDIAKSFEQAGAVAIGLHGRQVHERPSDSAHWDAFAPVVSSLSIPVLVNGDIFVREDIDKVRAMSGAKSFLIARGALSNASIFRKAGMLPYNDVVKDYLKVAAETDNVFQNTKYNLSRMIPTKCDADTNYNVTVGDLGATKSNLQMFALWDLQNYYEQTQELFVAKAKELQLPSGDIDDESFEVPAHSYDDAFVTKHQFYCNTCHVQLLSDKDVVLHKKGKKHKKKLRDISSATVSEQIAKTNAALQPPASAPVATENPVPAAPEGETAESERALKRVKRDEDEAFEIE